MPETDITQMNLVLFYLIYSPRHQTANIEKVALKCVGLGKKSAVIHINIQILWTDMEAVLETLTQFSMVADFSVNASELMDLT